MRFKLVAPEKANLVFTVALEELGINVCDFNGKVLSLVELSDRYDIDYEDVISAIEADQLHTHYNYMRDEILVDALEAAYFAHCIHPVIC